MGEMQEKPDLRLLRDYAENGSEAAFREIVERHTDLVYSATLRQVDSPDLARDISQSVFVDLARKAKPVSERLGEQASLIGWLYRSARFAVLTHLRDDRRRAVHERQAMEQLITDSGPALDWERIRPLLDEAMAELSDDHREAVLLRYFNNHDFRTVGQTMGISDDAAQKRVSRAVERLRDFFSKRGIAIGATGLVVVISANAIHAAPIGLATTISTAALVAATTIQTSAAITATKVIAMTTLQKVLVATAVVVLAGTGIYEVHQTSQLRALQQQQAPLTEQIHQLQQERDDATNHVARLTEELTTARGDNTELLKLRGEVGVLREQLAASQNSQNVRSLDPEKAKATPDSPSGDLARQLARAIVQGDTTALQRMKELAASRHAFFSTNRIGLNDEQVGAVQHEAFDGLAAAFNWLAEQATGGNANARQAIDQATQIDYLQGFAVNSLGKLAASGDQNALQLLLNPDQYGLLLSSTVGALGPAAENGNQQAIAALAAVLEDKNEKSLWHMASEALQGPAAAGNAVALEALKSKSAQQ